MEPIYSFDLKRFCLGTLCVYGHAWPGTTQSLKRISKVSSSIRKDFRRPNGIQVGNCIGCTGRKGSSWLLSFIDYEAMGWPANQTLGKLCKKEHKWEGQNASLRRWGKCVECEKLRKVEQSLKYSPRKTDRRWHPELRGSLLPAERKLKYRHMLRENLRAQGLTARGTVPNRADAGVAREERALERAISNTGHFPSVAKLVFMEQRRHWTENPEAYKEFNRERSKRRAHWRCMTDPEYRLYHRQNSRRRKALERGSVGIQVKGSEIAKRFAEFGNCCAYCGNKGLAGRWLGLQADHVNPISTGGTHVLSNLVPACRTCNSSKRAKDAEVWYRGQPFFCKKRWAKILKVMGAGKGSPRQLALL